MAKSAQKIHQKYQKKQQQKMAKKGPKSANKAGFDSIGATIRTHGENWCLLSVGFFLLI